MNVYPEDLENALRGQAGVRDCVVFGLERDGNAEPFAALLMDSPQSDARAAVSLANESLAEFQRIRNWYVWPEPDFPRTPTQKPILPKIREAALASHLATGGSRKRPRRRWRIWWRKLRNVRWRLLLTMRIWKWIWG